MARTHARVSRSLRSPLPRSFTACASVARTLADSTSYFCAPPDAASGAARAPTAASVARLRETRSNMPRRVGERHLGGGRVAPMLVLDHALLQAALADHHAMRNSHQLLVGAEH